MESSDAVSPWARFRAGHLLSAAGDTVVPVAMAGTMLLAGSGDERRTAGAALLVTVIPAAIAAPIVAAAVRRVRHPAPLLRWATALRALALVAAAAVLAAGQHIWVVVPVLACVLVGKAHTALRCSSVPLVAGHGVELVGANARVSRTSTIGTAVGMAVAAALVAIGPEVALAAGATAHLAATVVLWPLRGLRGVAGADVAPRRVQVPAAVRRARGSLVAIESGAGALLVLIMSGVAAGDLPAVALPAAAVAAGAANFVATWLAPRVRAQFDEPVVVVRVVGWCTVVLLATTSAAIAVVGRGGHAAAVVAVAVAAGVCIGVCNQIGRAAFDATIQEAVVPERRARVFAVSDVYAQMAYGIGGLLVLFGGFPLGVRLAVVSAGAASWITGHGAMAPRRRAVVRPVVSRPVGSSGLPW